MINRIDINSRVIKPNAIGAGFEVRIFGIHLHFPNLCNRQRARNHQRKGSLSDYSRIANTRDETRKEKEGRGGEG